MVRVFVWRGSLKQPFAISLFKNIWNTHDRFLTKTVLVHDNDVTAALHLLNRLMEREGLLKIVRQTQYYIKPCHQRNQLAIEASQAIFNEDLNRKMKFMMRKNRVDAFPGQISP